METVRTEDEIPDEEQTSSADRPAKYSSALVIFDDVLDDRSW